MEIEAPLEQTGPLSPEQEAALTGKEQQAEGENLLAGKFKTQEELEKGYKELESKLGEQSVQKEETPEQAETEETPVGNSGSQGSLRRSGCASDGWRGFEC